MLKNGAEANTLVVSEASVPLLLFALGWRNSVNMRVLGAAQVLASNSKPIVSLLLQAGVDIHACAPDGCTPLIATVCLGWEDLTTWLLQRGADVNAQTHSGVTALMLAGSDSDASLVHLLLDYGADIDKQDRYGMTALIMAVRQKKTAAIETLLQRGANVELTCSNEVDTAFSFARLTQNTDIMKQILQAETMK